jgi:trigger factor
MLPLPMQVSTKRVSPVMLELSVEVPADAVKTEIDKAYHSLARKAHIRGFRPGKAPRDVLARLYGNQVMVDVMNALVNNTLPKVLSENNVVPITQPNVEPGKVDAKEAFSYKARFEVTPEVEEVKYEGFEVTRPPASVSDEMVDAELEAIRLRHATLKNPEPARPAKTGDVVTIDFTISVDGKEIKDGGGQGVQIELGAGQALPELDAALDGKSTGDKVDADAKFGEAHPREDFRGKTGKFAITVTDIKERVLPALDDELAKDAGSFQTLVELRADVHTKLEKVMKDRSDMAVAEQIVQKLNDSNPLDLPPSLVEQQARVLEQEVALQARRLGQRITQDQLAGMQEQIRADAERKVRAGLLMAAIARKLEMKVTDDDIEKGLAELAADSGKNIAKLRVEYREKNKRDMLIGMILEDKILDYLESKSKITEGELQAKPSDEKKAGEGEEKAKKPKSKKAKDEG